MTPPRRRFVWEFDWNLLRTFMVIVQEKGLTAAGEKLSLKQPTISNALRRLETHMDCRLIERNASHFAVTPAGQRLFERMRRAVRHRLRPAAADGGTAGRRHRPCRDRARQPCRLPRSSTRCSPTSIATFPQVTMSMTVASSQEVAAAVANRDACFGVCLMQERQPKLEYESLYREGFGYFCGVRHPLFGKPAIRAFRPAPRTLCVLQDRPDVRRALARRPAAPAGGVRGC